MLQVGKTKDKLSSELLHTKHRCRRYLLQGAVVPGVPLLRVQTDNDSLAQEEGGPHDYVPDRTFSLVVQNEVKHHFERVKNEDENKSRMIKHIKCITENNKFQPREFRLSLTSKAHKEAEEDGIEETKADREDVLVDNSRQRKHKQHGYWSEALPR